MTRSHRGLTIERTMLVSTFVVAFMLGAQLRVDTDVWWHLRAGAYTAEHGVIRDDPFSFTKHGEAWIDHSWGAEVLFHWLWRIGGYGALELLTGLLALLGAILIYRMSAGGTYLRCLAVGLASFTASIFWTPRPQMFSFALAALVLYVIHLRRHEGVDLLWWLPLTMLVWANLHGGFVIGLGLIGATMAGEFLEALAPFDDRGHLGAAALRKLTLVFMASLAAVCVNPYGPRLLGVPFDTANSGYGRLIEEWMPPDLHAPSFWPFTLMLALFVFAVGVSPVRLGWTDGLLGIGATLLALSAGRNVSTFAVVVTPIITYHLHATLEERGVSLRPMRRASARVAAANVVLLLVLVGVAAGRISPAFRDERFAADQRRTLPVDSVSYLRVHGVQGRLFNDYQWGGYLLYALPGTPVFVDGRTDLYGADFLESPYRYIVDGGPGWNRLLRQYRVRTVLVPRTSGLASVMARARAWRWMYSDRVSVVFERGAYPTT